MKTNTKLVLTLAVFTLISPIAWAHEGHGDHEGKSKDPAKMADHLKDKLSLSDDQAAKVKDIITKFQQDKEGILNQLKSLKEQKHNDIAALLNDEQRAKYEKMGDKMKDKDWKKHGEKHHDDDDDNDDK